MRTTTAVHSEETLLSVNHRAALRENNLALCALMYAQGLSMSALSLLSIASTSSYLSALLSILPAALLYALSSLCAKKRAYQLPRLLSFVFALLLFSDMALCLMSLIELVCAYVLPSASRVAIALPTALFTGLSLTGKKRGGARRTAAFLGGFFLVALLICLIFALPAGNRGHLYPLLGYGGGQTLRGGIYMTGSVWSAGILPFFTQGENVPELKKRRAYLPPLLTLLLLALLLFFYAYLLPAPLLPGDWGFVLRLQLIMEMSPNTLSWSLMLISRMLLFLSGFAVAGDTACECLHTAFDRKKAPILPLMLLSVPLALLPLDQTLPALEWLLPLRYVVSFLSVLLALFVRKREAAA